MSKPNYIHRRGEIIAELFLGDLKPTLLVQVPDSDQSCDYFAGFRTKNGSIYTIGVEVLATEEPVPPEYIFPATGRRLDMLTGSNLPLLLLVVDVKLNEVFFNWATAVNRVKDPSVSRSALLRLPVYKATPKNKEVLISEIKSK